MAKRLVYIEDNTDIQTLYGEYLTAHGYDVACYTDPGEGLTHVLADPPDLVLLDVLMPGMSGLELAQHLRANAGTTAVPIIILSVTAAFIEPQLIAGLGLRAVLIKPCPPKTLLAEVAAAVGAA